MWYEIQWKGLRLSLDNLFVSLVFNPQALFLGPTKQHVSHEKLTFLVGVGHQDDAEIIKKACAQPEQYVLKPQREGGGHNFYGYLDKWGVSEV